MSCSDQLLLHRLMDGDLDETEAELLSFHLESCADCRSSMAVIAAERTFVQDRLGAEDDEEQETAASALASIANRLPPHPVVARVRRGPRWRAWLASAACASFVILISLPFVPSLDALPTRILAEASARERRWMYQPDRVLHWEVQTLSKGVEGWEDGLWRTEFWQNNGATSFDQISRQTDPSGRTRRAHWQQPDGSTMMYRSGERVIEVSPSTAAVQQALPALNGEMREALQSYLVRRGQARDLDHNNRQDPEWLHRASSGNAGGKVTFRDGPVPWSGVHHITVEKGPSPWSPMIMGSVHEYELEVATFRLLRLKSTIHYRSGTTGVHDSSWVNFREASLEEFHAGAPRELLNGEIPVVRLTPLQIAHRHQQERNQTTIN